MILTKTDLAVILKENPTRKIWDEAREQAKRLQMHVLGSGLQAAINRIENLEGDKNYAVRKKYAKSNRDLFARVLRPIDNIWSGRGGSAFYNTSKENDERIRAILSNVNNGISARDWTRLFWMKRYLDDPMSIIFMEVKADRTYPVYKSSANIFDALPAGRRLEYVVFKTADPSIFRVVDDALDQLVKLDGEKIQILQGKKTPQFINWFGQVPAIITSDIPRDGREDMYASPIADEVELADIVLREGSIAGIYRFKHGFPRTWKYPEVCGKCKGTKLIQGAECKDCDGTGIKINDSPGDVSVHAWPTKEEPEIREKGGYITPDLDYLKYADETLQLLEDKMVLTHWGTQRKQKTNGEEPTATSEFININPVNNRLTQYAKAAETTETFISDMIGIFNFPGAYKGATINLGRRWILDGPDVLWNKYEKARKEGAPLATLDDMLEDYYETKFQGNELELRKFLKLAKLEPAVHLTVKEAKDTLPTPELMKKIYFQEWVSTLSDIQIVGGDLKTLRTAFETYVQAKVDALPDEEDPAADPAAPGQDPKKKKPAGQTK